MRRVLPILGLLIAWVILLGAPACPPPAPQPTPTPCVSCPAGQHCEGTECVADPPPPGECPAPPQGAQVCDGPQQCGCWACSGRTGYVWTEMPACPPPCPAAPSCPPGTHAEVQSPGNPCVIYTGRCVADAPPAASWCPKPLGTGATLKLRVKKYGNGVDSTVYVVGDPAFCEAIRGQPDLAQCHLEGWQTRVQCEMELMGGCPTWRYRSGAEVGVCHDDRVSAAVSCDHFGAAGGAHDDPRTPTTGNTLATLEGFEGEPVVCGLQRDSYGPKAGPWTMPQCTKGKPCEVAACLPDGTGCSGYLTVDWRAGG